MRTKATRRPPLVPPAADRSQSGVFGGDRLEPDRSASRPAANTMVQSTGLPIDPFAWDAHATAMFERQIMLAPVVVNWRYRVCDQDRFRDWLATRDIVLSVERLGSDERLAGIRYGGTYFVPATLGDAGESLLKINV